MFRFLLFLATSLMWLYLSKSDSIWDQPYTAEPVTTNNCNNGINNWEVDYVGDSSKFKLFSPCDNSTYFISIDISNLIELDINGKQTKNKITTFSNQDFKWITDNGYDSMYQNYSITQNTFMANLDISNDKNVSNVIPFNLTTFFFENAANVTFNNGYLESIPQYTLKWSVYIDEWPFLNPNNTLLLSMTIHVGGNTHYSQSNNENTIAETGNKRYQFSNGFNFETPDYATIDDNETTPINVTLDSANQRNLRVFLLFPYFEQSLQYDPIVYYDEESDDNQKESNESVNEWVYYGLAIGITVIVIVLIAYYCHRRHVIQEAKLKKLSLADYHQISPN